MIRHNSNAIRWLALATQIVGLAGLVACGGPQHGHGNSYVCTQDSDCPSGEFCDLATQLCGPPQPVDAGPEDAGVVDAGTADAGPVDAGPQDAGMMTMGNPDGGTDGGSPDGGDVDAGACIPPGMGYVAPDGGVPPTWTGIWNDIINGPPGCGLCHSTPTMQGGLNLGATITPDVAYAELVNHPVGSMDPPWPVDLSITMRVVPCDPAHSALAVAVEQNATLPMALEMPFDEPPLTPQQIDAIIGWIQYGAPND